MVASAVDHPLPVSPDYVTDPDAVLKDAGVEWRYGIPPNYSKTRSFFEQTKQHHHAAGSLEAITENLVKNWEIEASFKKRLSDWRTVNHDKYTFAIHGGQPKGAEEMLKVGTYNAIILPNEYYDPASTDFAQSHKTFKRMMPTFAWSVVETYSPPPRISFKWRHWGVMANDYCGINNKGEKVTVKAHGRVIDITGITIADIDENLKITSLKTYFDSMQMFRQIVGDGEVTIEKLDEVHETVVTTGHTEGAINTVGPPSTSSGKSSSSSPSKTTRSVGFVLPDQETERVQISSDGGEGRNGRETRPREERKISLTRLASKLGFGSGGGNKEKRNGITPDVARDAKAAYDADMPHDKVHPVLKRAEYRQASNKPGNVPADHQESDPHAQLGQDMGSLNIDECPVMSGLYKKMSEGPMRGEHAKGGER